jgi:hypothetical protein
MATCEISGSSISPYVLIDRQSDNIWNLAIGPYWSLDASPATLGKYQVSCCIRSLLSSLAEAVFILLTRLGTSQ